MNKSTKQWNTVVDQQDSLAKRWDELEEKGSELEALRAQQMRALAKRGHVTTVIPEMVQTVLESITVIGNGKFIIRFLDGTEFRINY